MTDYTLYGAQLSLYSGKVRSYLRYKAVDFEEVVARPAVYRKIIIPQTGVRYIPVVKTPDGRFIQDSSVIIEEIEKLVPERPVIPKNPRQLIVSRLLEMYADEWLLIPAMHYRWNKNQENFVYGEFGKLFAPRRPKLFQRYIGRKAGSRFRDFVPMLGINESTIPAIEDWYEKDLLPALDRHFAEYDYLLGNSACIGDFALMGPLYSHLYRDPRSGEMMHSLGPNVVSWIERMNKTPDLIGALPYTDHVPDTLIPIVTRLFTECMPAMQAVVRNMNEFRAEHPNEGIPRFVGKVAFRIGDCQGLRMAPSFCQWKLQRVIDSYNSLSTEGKSSVDQCLRALGGEFAVASMQQQFENRVVRQNNRLVWAS
jgi:glutathione S-transferase